MSQEPESPSDGTTTWHALHLCVGGFILDPRILEVPPPSPLRVVGPSGAVASPHTIESLTRALRRVGYTYTAHHPASLAEAESAVMQLAGRLRGSNPHVLLIYDGPSEERPTQDDLRSHVQYTYFGTGACSDDEFYRRLVLPLAQRSNLILITSVAHDGSFLSLPNLVYLDARYLDRGVPVASDHNPEEWEVTITARRTRLTRNETWPCVAVSFESPFTCENLIGRLVRALRHGTAPYAVLDFCSAVVADMRARGEGGRVLVASSLPLLEMLASVMHPGQPEYRRGSSDSGAPSE